MVGQVGITHFIPHVRHRSSARGRHWRRGCCSCMVGPQRSQFSCWRLGVDEDAEFKLININLNTMRASVHGAAGCCGDPTPHRVHKQLVGRIWLCVLYALNVVNGECIQSSREQSTISRSHMSVFTCSFHFMIMITVMWTSAILQVLVCNA